MKKLFKAAFKSIIKSKIGIILLSSIVFLTAGTFTLFNSASNAFQQSYKSVTEKGNLHDFTVKELYSVEGEPNLEPVATKLTNPSANALQAGDIYKVEIKSTNPTGSYKFLSTWNSSQYDSFLSNKLDKYPLELQASDYASLMATPSDWNDTAKLMRLPEVQKLIEEAKDEFKQEVVNDSSKRFIDEIDTKYVQKGLLNFSKVQSVEVNSAAGARKIVSTDSNAKVDSIVKFNGYKMPTQISLNGESYNAPMSSSDLERILKDFNTGIPSSAKIIDKGYRISATWGGMIPKNASIMDPTSFMAYISPSYAGKNKLEYIKPGEIVSLYEEAIKNNKNNALEWLENEFRSLYSKSIVWVDQTPYIAIGSGTTPDFSYPIIGPDKPMPNVRDEVILFTNSHGYARIEDAFRGSPKENYLAYKFTAKAHGKEEEIFNDVEAIAQKNMSWGNSVDHIASKTFDTSEKVILAPNRISFLATLERSMLTLSIILTISLIIFIIIVISLVIKKHINSHKKSYGILLANGYSKAQVALASTVIALVSIIIPAGLGYISGHFMQYVLLDQFSNVWTLPISGHAFNLWAFLGIIIFPFLLVSFLTFAITMWEIRGSIPEIMAGASSKMSSYLSSRILGPLKFVGIKTKASMSLFITNISKMLLVFVSTTMAIITIAISISTIHKFDNAKASSVAATSYSYDVTFSAPTKEGGVLKATHLYELGLTDDQKKDDKTILDYLGKDTITDSRFTTDLPLEKDTFMYPNAKDDNIKDSPYYLKHLIQAKSLLNIFAGYSIFGFRMGANPWDLAKKLMPENQMNIVNKQDTNFIEYSAKLSENEDYLPGKAKSILTKDKDGKYIIDQSQDLFSSKKPFLKDFFWNGFKAAYEQYRDIGSLKNMPYFITYGSAIIGNNDETYTNVTGFTTKSNFRNNSNKHSFSIKGIKENSKYINLSESVKNALKENYDDVMNEKLPIPVIVNRYFAAYYKVKKGDIIDYTVTNSANRFEKGTGDLTTKDVKLKVVGFQNSYNDQQVYTLQDYARVAMNWKPSDGGFAEMFNGVFTKEKNPVIFNSLALYSLSGFYPGTDTISSNPNDPITKNISKEVQDNPPYPTITNINDYFATYKQSPYVAFSNVNWKGAESFRFKTTSDLSSVLIIFIESITIFLSVLFIIIISVMMIEDNKKFISTLKVMGYRSREITRIFFGSFVPSFVLAIFVSAPIAFGVAELIRFAIMSFGSILIPLSLTWWTIFISFGITFIGAMITYWLSTRSLKNTRMLQAFSQ